MNLIDINDIKNFFKDFSVNLIFSITLLFLVVFIGKQTIDMYYTYKESKSLKVANTKLLSLLKKVDTENKLLKYREDRVSTYETELISKMSKLESVIIAASKLKMIESSKLSADKGIGGLETDCVSENCSLSKSDVRASIDPQAIKIVNSLVSRAENFTELLSKVPFLIPVNSFVSSGYGPRRSPFSRKVKHHGGIDFSAPYGSEVLSTADGRIKRVARSATYGIYIDVDHGNNVITRYAHLSKALVKRGEKVCATQRIGLVGSTGRSTGAHLHYEIRVNGKTVDPLKIINF